MISFVIPVNNASITLPRCLSSLQIQTVRDWECLLIDDGSSDGSSEICDEWRKTDGRFIVFHQSNQGVSAARNKGVELCRGDLICFIDADDFIEPTFLEIAIQNLGDADMVIAGDIREWRDGRTQLYCPVETKNFPLLPTSSHLFLDLCRNYLLSSLHGSLYKKEIIDCYGITFPDSCWYGEDLQFNFDYLNHVKAISTISLPLYHYSMGNNSLSTRQRPEQFNEDYSQWMIMSDFFSRHDMMTKDVEAFLYKRLWGIVYDSLFSFPWIKNQGLEYYKRILSIPEMPCLKDYSCLFDCANWIKSCILHRQCVLLYLYFKLLR